MPDIDSFLAPLPTLFAAGVGAFFANFIAEFMKSLVRKSQNIELARDDDLSTLLKWVDEMQVLATEYWTKSGQDLGSEEPVLRARIVARQQNTLDIVAHLFNGDPKRVCDVDFTRFMDAVGGGDFGEPDRPADPRRLVSVYRLGLAFMHLAKRSRRNLKRGWLA